MALTVWLLTLPAAVRFYYPLLRGSAHAPDAVKVAEWLRTPYRERTLNLSMIGGQFTSKELKHYSEVRSLRPWPPRLSAVLAVLLLVALGVHRPDRRELQRGLQRGLALCLVLFATTQIAACLDWRTVFAALHQPLFGDHSWRFGRAAYSLQLFPERFWRWLYLLIFAAPLLALGAGDLILKISLVLRPQRA